MIFEILPLLLISVVFAVIVESPLIYARIKNKKLWVPVNSPPWMLGDDYYYFSVLNQIHKDFLNKNFNLFKSSKLSIMSTFQFTGYLFNLIPYHIGYKIEDKRLGVLFVKIWNRIMLSLSIFFFSQQVFNYIDFEISFEKLALILLLYFFVYPGPISFISLRRGIFFNIFNSKHMFNHAHVNDLTRGMHSETTAPLLIFFTGYTFHILTNNSELLELWIPFFSIILFFQYFPAFAVYSFFSLLILMFLNSYIFFLCLFIIYILLTYLYLKALSQCDAASELIAHDDGGKIFNINFRSLIDIFFVILINYLFFINMHLNFLYLMFFSFSIFVLTQIFFKHQMSRFWTRGATIIFQLLIIIIISYIIFLTNTDYQYFFIILVLIGYLIYFYINSIFLYKTGATLIPSKINESKISKIFDTQSYGLNFVSESVETSYYINLFTNNNAMLENFTIQKNGYKKHLKKVCINFKAVGYELNQVTELLTTNSKNWRSNFLRENIPDNYSYYHELQYIVSNYRFNRKIVEDGMYINNIWTEQYKSLIKEIWNSIDKSDYKNMIKI